MSWSTEVLMKGGEFEDMSWLMRGLRGELVVDKVVVLGIWNSLFEIICVWRIHKVVWISQILF